MSLTINWRISLYGSFCRIKSALTRTNVTISVVGGFIFRFNSFFFTLNTRVSRTFRFGPRVRLEGMLEAFNLTNRRNDLTRNGNFGSGAYPTDPSPTFNQITAVADPRSFQFGLRVQF